jgi:hypothetical protein
MKSAGKKGKKPIRYGDRTFVGWEAYYRCWGVRTPCARTISSHYLKNKTKGLSDDEIITAQKKLWLEGITAKDEQHAES